MTAANNLPISIDPIPDADRINVTAGGEPFTSYLYGDEVAELTNPVLYPIRTSQSTEVTRGYPIDPRPEDRRDHAHHAGLWLAYGDVNGIDFWTHPNQIPPGETDGFGTVRHRDVERIDEGEDRGELAVTMAWEKPNGDTVLDQETSFGFRAGTDERVVDHVTTLRANAEPVTFRDNKEGMLGLRVRRELEHPAEETIMGPADDAEIDVKSTGGFLSSDGVRGTDVWGTRARWMCLTGYIQEERVSLAMFDHPENVGYPTSWIARGYGLLGPNPFAASVFGDGESMNFKLDPGEAVTFRYRTLLRTGDLSADDLHSRQKAFAADVP